MQCSINNFISKIPFAGKLQFHPLSSVADFKGSELPLHEMFSVLHKVKTATVGYLKVEMYNYTSFKPLFSWTVPYQVRWVSLDVTVQAV